MSAVKALFDLISALLPVDHKLPTYSKSKAAVTKTAGIPAKHYEVCKCGKTMYRGDLLHAEKCPLPECDRARVRNGKKTTTRYSHIGLLSQLRCLFWDEEWRRNTELKGNPNAPVMRSIHDSPSWNKYLEQHPEFARVPTNLLLCYCTDGVTPFKGSEHTMWPQMWKVLNLPPHLSSKTELVLLSGVTHGPKSPTSLQAILELHVEELHALWEGVTVQHPHNPEHEEVLRASLFCTSADYRGFEKINSQQGTNSGHGCMECLLQGTHDGVTYLVWHVIYMAKAPSSNPGSDRFSPKLGFTVGLRGEGNNPSPGLSKSPL